MDLNTQDAATPSIFYPQNSDIKAFYSANSLIYFKQKTINWINNIEYNKFCLLNY
jgi:hypothetical protein